MNELNRLTDQELSNWSAQCVHLTDWAAYAYSLGEVIRRMNAGTWTDPDPEEEEN